MEKAKNKCELDKFFKALGVKPPSKAHEKMVEKIRQEKEEQLQFAKISALMGIQGVAK